MSLSSDARLCPELVDMLPDNDGVMFEGFREHLLLPDADYNHLMQVEGEPGLYFDQVSKHHRRKCLSLLHDMDAR